MELAWDQLSSLPATELGRTPFGTLYSATMPDGAKIVIKRVDSGLSSFATRQEYETEKQLLTEMRDPHVTRLAGFCDERCALVYMGLSGSTLRSNLVSDFTWAHRVNVLAGAAEGALALHCCNPPVMHRNICPSSIKLDADGQGVLGDIGIGKATRGLTTNFPATDGSMFLAPELQEQGTTFNAKGDTYALGVTVLQSMSGRTDERLVFDVEAASDSRPSTWFSSFVDPTFPQRPPEGELRELANIALRCIQPADDRCTLGEAVVGLRNLARAIAARTGNAGPFVTAKMQVKSDATPRTEDSQSLGRENEVLHMELRRLERTNADLKVEMDNLRFENAKLVKKLNTNREAAELEAVLHDTQRELEVTTQRIHELEEMLAEGEAHRNALVMEVRAMRPSSDNDSSAVIEQLRQELAESLETNRMHKMELEAIRMEVAQVRTEASRTPRDNKHVRAAEDAQMELARLKALVAQLREEKEDLLARSRDRDAQMSSDGSALIAESRALRMELSATTQALEESREVNAELRARGEMQREHIALLAEKVAALETALTRH